jgi:hypothetical protein
MRDRTELERTADEARERQLPLLTDHASLS